MKYQRKSTRLPGFDYSLPGAYFITINVHGRGCLFGKVKHGEMKLNRCGEIVSDVWKNIPKRYDNVTLDMYVIMPDHVHGIIVVNSSVGAIHELPLREWLSMEDKRRHRRKMLLAKIVGYFKMNTSRRINILYKTSGKVWQRNYYDHIIRNDDDLKRVREYIVNNPARWEDEPNT